MRLVFSGVILVREGIGFTVLCQSKVEAIEKEIYLACLELSHLADRRYSKFL